VRRQAHADSCRDDGARAGDCSRRPDTRPIRCEPGHGGRYQALGEDCYDRARSDSRLLRGVGTSGMLMGTGARCYGAPMRRPESWRSSRDIRGALGRTAAGMASRGRTRFVPPQFDHSLVSEIRAIDEAEARRMAGTLARQEGLFAGTSHGPQTSSPRSSSHASSGGDRPQRS